MGLINFCYLLLIITAKEVPFRVKFTSDNWEYNNAGATAADEGGSTGVTKQAGFKLRYYSIKTYIIEVYFDLFVGIPKQPAEYCDLKYPVTTKLAPDKDLETAMRILLYMNY